MQYELRVTNEFNKWLKSLRDMKAKRAVQSRIARMEAGLFGDWKSVGSGVRELRIPVSKGYRVYYTERDNQIIVLLVGGHKGSQKQDIERAKEMMNSL